MSKSPWQILERVFLTEDTAGNISRILGFSPEWAQQFVSKFKNFAFTAAKMVAFNTRPEQRKWTLSWWDDRIAAVNDLSGFEGKHFVPLNDIMKLLKQKPQLAAKLNGAKTFDEFNEIAYSMFSSFKPSGKTFMEFPDGYKWIALGVGSSSQEGELMQHCGHGAGGELYSLRDPQGNPHVTIEYDPDEKTLHQVRGKQNAKPIPKYVPYIKDFVRKTGANIAYDSGWDDSWD